jgi:integrase/recombinase XerD
VSRGQDGPKAAPRRPCWPVERWPAVDQAAWALALTPGDPFQPGGLAVDWALVSRRLIATGYGKWLAWLDERGLLDPTAPPASRATRALVSTYAKDLQATYSPLTVQGRVQQLGDALRVMTPGEDLRWITRGAWRLRSRAKPIKDKRARLQSPVRLIALGVRLMTAAESEPVTLESAMAFRDGLTIAFLAYRPVRIRNLAMIRCDRHLVRRGDGWWVAFAGEEMKAKRPLEFPFPAELAAHLETYLATYRPVLLTRGGKQAPAPISELWVSRKATALGGQTIAQNIQRHTRAEFGTELNPHLFRDCAATWIAIYNPEHVQIIAAILGHSTLETSERYYNQARGLEAGRRYHRTIKGIRARKP